jgi:hypothetical protein
MIMIMIKHPNLVFPPLVKWVEEIGEEDDVQPCREKKLFSKALEDRPKKVGRVETSHRHLLKPNETFRNIPKYH